MESENTNTLNNNCETIDEKLLDILYNQAPLSCTREIIINALKTTKNNVSETLDIIWNIPKPPPKPFRFLDDVREIADAHDEAMEAQDMKNKYFKTI